MKTDYYDRVVYVDGYPEPEQMDRSTIYIEQDGDGSPLIAAFLCPCGCGKSTIIGLHREFSPNWMLDRHEDGTISFHPSLNRSGGCESHFYIRHSRVSWCQ